MRFEDRGFPSVRELLDYHVQNKIYVTKKSQAILVNPVLKEKDKWEMRREDIILKDKLGQGETKHATGLETCTKIYFLFIFNLV